MLDNRWEFLEDEYEEESRFVRIPRKLDHEGSTEPPYNHRKLDKKKRRVARLMKEHQGDDAPLPTKDDDSR